MKNGKIVEKIEIIIIIILIIKIDDSLIIGVVTKIKEETIIIEETKIEVEVKTIIGAEKTKVVIKSMIITALIKKETASKNIIHTNNTDLKNNGVTQIKKMGKKEIVIRIINILMTIDNKEVINSLGVEIITDIENIDYNFYPGCVVIFLNLFL